MPAMRGLLRNQQSLPMLESIGIPQTPRPGKKAIIARFASAMAAIAGRQCTTTPRRADRAQWSGVPACKGAHRDEILESVMCRTMISVD